jgi:hypothetical protein
MRTRWFSVVALSGALAFAGCGTSGGSDDDAAGESTSTEAPASTEAPTTTEDPTTTEAPTTEVPTSEVDPTTTTVASGAALDCEEVLAQYAAAFDPADMSEVIALFRSWVPSMPEDVGAATTRLADAYEDADANLANINMADVDLTADAQVFSDWTNEGCPPG